MLSIIIPVYNGEEFIEKCYKSIGNPSSINIEIIFIDDGSSDKSLSLLRKIEEDDQRIKVITQSNKGVVIARDMGIKEASFDYITFLDIDDTFMPRSLDVVTSFLDNDIDILVSKFYYSYPDKENRNIIIENRNYSSDVSSFLYLKKILVSAGWELCGKIYRKSLFLDNIILPTERIRIGEDALIFIQLVLNSQKIRLITQPFYNYYQHLESASNIKSDEYAKEGMYAAKFINDILYEKKLSDSLKDQINAMNLLFYSNSLRRGYITDQEIISDIKKRLNAKSLKLVGLKKSLFILLNLYGGKHINSFILNFIYRCY